MSAAVVLDAGPLSTLASPHRSAQPLAARQWLAALQAAGRRVLVAEIADYEVRRELLRANKPAGVANLDQLGQQLEYLPVTTAAMRKAAELWAQARQLGHQTAADPALDGDVILAAQALTLGTAAVVVATTNVGHLSRFVPAELWQNIAP
jgi:predicted nucleic acid-binding protein